MKKKILTLIFFSLFTNLMGATYFAPVSVEDVKEFQEKPQFVPDANITGSYQYGYSQYKPLTFSKQRFSINFQSEVHRLVNFNLSITNTPYLQGISNKNEHDFALNQTDIMQQNYDEFSLKADLAYLDFQFVPQNHFKIGKQKIAVGDQLGLVYLGKNLSVVLNCGVGTWCLNMGAAKINNDDQAQLKWYSLVYPIFDNGNKKNDKWSPNNERPESKIILTFYRLFQNDGYAVTQNGDRTLSYDAVLNPKYSPTQLKNADNYVNLETSRQYFGLNLEWFYFNNNFNFYYAQVFGDITYHDSSNGINNTILGHQKIRGDAWYLDYSYNISDIQKIGFNYLFTTGNKIDSTAELQQPWKRQTTAYHAIQPGVFGKNKIYFDGYEGQGQAHSISNITSMNINYSYDPIEDFRIDLLFSDIARSEPVLNADNKKVKKIGNEIDFIFVYQLASNMDIDLALAYFIPDLAYVEKDSEIPLSEKEEPISQFHIDLKYTF